MAKKIQYKKLIKGSFCSIVSKVTKDNFTEIEFFFDDLDSCFSSNIDGLLLIMKEHSNNGNVLLTTENCHRACTENKISIYEYRKGRLRIYWFYDELNKNIVVCSHGIIKKAQKTDKSDKEKAVKNYKDYHNNRDNIVFIEDDVS